MSTCQIRIDRRTLGGFCRRHHIRSLALFGSVLRGDFGPGSDVDVLVEFEEGHVPGLKFIDIQDELSELLGGRAVDLVTADSLNRRIRPQVLAEREILYARP
jgi:predicted nucleotidyltransferase